MTARKLADIEKVDYYITGDKRLGRILACKKPFHRGDGVFEFPTDLSDWECQGKLSLTEDEMREYIDHIRKAHIHALKEIIHIRRSEGFRLEENPPGVFTVHQDEPPETN